MRPKLGRDLLRGCLRWRRAEVQGLLERAVSVTKPAPVGGVDPDGLRAVADGLDDALAVRHRRLGARRLDDLRNALEYLEVRQRASRRDGVVIESRACMLHSRAASFCSGEVPRLRAPVPALRVRLPAHDRADRPNSVFAT